VGSGAHAESDVGLDGSVYCTPRAVSPTFATFHMRVPLLTVDTHELIRTLFRETEPTERSNAHRYRITSSAQDFAIGA
jgi:hypothetical protein